MYDFHKSRFDVDRDDFGISYQVMPFDREQDSASERLARQFTSVAVSKIADPTIRKRVRYLVEPKVASRVAINQNRGAATLVTARSLNQKWERFVTEKPDSGYILGFIAGQTRNLDTTNIQVKDLCFGLNLTETFHVLDIDTHEEVTEPKNKVDTLQDSETEISAFEAKPDLISAWLEGLNAVRAEGGHDALPPLSSDTQEKYAAELTRQLRKVISNFAKRKAYEGGAYRITFARKFLPSIESLIEDHLMLPPRSAVEFLDIFKGELYRQSSDKAVFSGRWGELNIDDAGELVLSLQKRRARKLSSLLRGK